MPRGLPQPDHFQHIQHQLVQYHHKLQQNSLNLIALVQICHTFCSKIPQAGVGVLVKKKEEKKFKTIQI